MGRFLLGWDADGIVMPRRVPVLRGEEPAAEGSCHLMIVSIVLESTD